jgi:hypothetical protein
MLSHFRLVTQEELRQLSSGRPTVYALTFEVEGQLAKVGWSMFPAARIPSLISEQAAPVKEIWLAEVSVPEIFIAGGECKARMALRRFGRAVQAQLADSRIRNEFFRAPMRAIDEAFSSAIEAQPI